MLAPINYMLENKNPLDSFFGGMKAVQGVQQDDNTLKQQELVNEKQAALQQRQAEYDAAVDQVDIGDMSAMQGIMTRFPEMSKGVQDAYDKLDEKRKQATVSNLSRLSSLIKNGKSSDAITLLQQQVEGSRNAGNEQEAKEAEAMIETIRISPDAGLQTMTWGLANILPKDAAVNYKDVSTAYNDKDELPSKINKNQATAFKDNVDATNTVSEGLSTAAIGGDAAGFSLKVGMMYAQGLITDNQKTYIDERLADKDPEAVKEFLDGLAGQNVEIAKLNKPEVSIVNAGGQLVAIKKNADGSVVVVGSVDKTLSPDVEYAQDAASARTEYTTDAQVGIANQRDATVRQSQELTKYLADQKAEISSGKFTQKTMPDGRVLLFNDKGEWKPVLDSNGKPMISKKSVADKPLTESQGNSLMYGKRMQSANKILEGLEANGTMRGWSLVGVKNEEQRKYEQAQRNFINAILRKESGAAIGADEFDSAKKQYFPAFLDSEAVIKQKAATRRQVADSMLSNAGPKGEATKNKATKTDDLF